MVAATRRASSTASIEQQPRSRCRSPSRGHIASVIPMVRSPRAAQRAAATDESTPPDMATATTASAGTQLERVVGDQRRGTRGRGRRGRGGHRALQRPPATAGTMESSSRSPTGVSRPWLKRMSESLT